MKDKVMKTKIDKDKYGAEYLYLHFRSGVYSFQEELSHTEVYTCFTKDQYCGRGDYSEEIDVAVLSRPARYGELAEAKRVVQAALDYDYEPGLRWSRFVYRPAGIMFF